MSDGGTWLELAVSFVLAVLVDAVDSKQVMELHTWKHSLGFKKILPNVLKKKCFLKLYVIFWDPQVHH